MTPMNSPGAATRAGLKNHSMNKATETESSLLMRRWFRPSVRPPKAGDARAGSGVVAQRDGVGDHQGVEVGPVDPILPARQTGWVR